MNQENLDKGRRRIEMMPSLPEDIIINILTRLPVKSLSRFRCVRKSWSNLFKNPNFVKTQFDHSLQHHSPGILIDCFATPIRYVDYDPVSSTVSNEVIKIGYPDEFKRRQIVDVCNGLILYVTDMKDFIIWNPFTNDCKKLPNPPESTAGLDTKYQMNQYGFGYDARTDDYLFGMMVSSRCNKEYSELSVYSSRTNSWKTMPNIPYRHRFKKLVLFNGIFHWVDFPTLGTELVMSSFDFRSETFKEIQLPQELSDEKFHVVDLHLIQGCLYLVGSMYMVGVEVWMMKEYGVKESWTKMFTIDGKKFDGFSGLLNLKNSLGNGVISVELNYLHPLPCLYDLNKEEARRLEIKGISRMFSVWAFLGSLVSPTFVTSLGTQ